MNDEIPYEPFFDYRSNVVKIDINQDEENLGLYFEGFTAYLSNEYKKKKEHLRELAQRANQVDVLVDTKDGNQRKVDISTAFIRGGVGELLGHMSTFQGKFVTEMNKRNKNQRTMGINFHDPKASHHLQSFVQAIERASR